MGAAKHQAGFEKNLYVASMLQRRGTRYKWNNFNSFNANNSIFAYYEYNINTSNKSQWSLLMNTHYVRKKCLEKNVQTHIMHIILIIYHSQRTCNELQGLAGIVSIRQWCKISKNMGFNLYFKSHNEHMFINPFSTNKITTNPHIKDKLLRTCLKCIEWR